MIASFHTIARRVLWRTFGFALTLHPWRLALRSREATQHASGREKLRIQSRIVPVDISTRKHIPKPSSPPVCNTSYQFAMVWKGHWNGGMKWGFCPSCVTLGNTVALWTSVSPRIR